MKKRVRPTSRSTWRGGIEGDQPEEDVYFVRACSDCESLRHLSMLKGAKLVHSNDLASFQNCIGDDSGNDKGWSRLCGAED
jgi:hypothetical protein